MSYNYRQRNQDAVHPPDELSQVTPRRRIKNPRQKPLRDVYRPKYTIGEGNPFSEASDVLRQRYIRPKQSRKPKPKKEQQDNPPRTIPKPTPAPLPKGNQAHQVIQNPRTARSNSLNARKLEQALLSERILKYIEQRRLVNMAKTELVNLMPPNITIPSCQAKPVDPITPTLSDFTQLKTMRQYIEGDNPPPKVEDETSPRLRTASEMIYPDGHRSSCGRRPVYNLYV